MPPASRDQLQRGPSVPLAALRAFYPWPGPWQVFPAPSLRRSSTAGTGRALPPQSDRGPQERPLNPVGPGAASRRGSPGKQRVLGCPCSWRSPLFSLEPGGALGRVRFVSASPSPPFSFLFFLRVIGTLLVALIAGNDHYLNLGHGSDPSYR